MHDTRHGPSHYFLSLLDSLLFFSFLFFSFLHFGLQARREQALFFFRMIPPDHNTRRHSRRWSQFASPLSCSCFTTDSQRPQFTMLRTDSRNFQAFPVFPLSLWIPEQNLNLLHICFETFFYVMMHSNRFLNTYTTRYGCYDMESFVEKRWNLVYSPLNEGTGCRQDQYATAISSGYDLAVVQLRLAKVGARGVSLVGLYLILSPAVQAKEPFSIPAGLLHRMQTRIFRYEVVCGADEIRSFCRPSPYNFQPASQQVCGSKESAQPIGSGLQLEASEARPLWRCKKQNMGQLSVTAVQ